MTRDPAPPAAGNPESINQYVYCEGDPIQASDATGEAPDYDGNGKADSWDHNWRAGNTEKATKQWNKSYAKKVGTRSDQEAHGAQEGRAAAERKAVAERAVLTYSSARASYGPVAYGVDKNYVTTKSGTTVVSAKLGFGLSLGVAPADFTAVSGSGHIGTGIVDYNVNAIRAWTTNAGALSIENPFGVTGSGWGTPDAALTVVYVPVLDCYSLFRATAQ